MADNSFRRDAMAFDDIPAQADQRFSLAAVKFALSERAVADFDADRTGIEVGGTAPVADAGMPGTFVFADALKYRAVIIDHIM